MQYKLLGNTGLQVSTICLGTMTFGPGEGIWGKIGGSGQAEADELIKASVDAGVNFIDTADVYSAGHSEETLGRSLKNLGIARKDLVIATKALRPDGPWQERCGGFAWAHYGCGGREFEAAADGVHRPVSDSWDGYR